MSVYVPKNYSDNKFETGGRDAPNMYGGLSYLEYLKQESAKCNPTGQASLASMVKYGWGNSNLYQIWILSAGAGTHLQLPWLPASYKISRGSKHKTVDIIGLGESLVINQRAADTISFSSRFPNGYIPGSPPFKKPEVCKKILLDLAEREKYIRFVITKTDINLCCVVTNLAFSEKGGDVGTIYYDITLKEYRMTEPRKVALDPDTGVALVPPENSGAEQRLDDLETPKTYTLQCGDSLRSIAQKVLGNENRWIDIYNINLVTNGGTMQHPLMPGNPGTVIKLP